MNFLELIAALAAFLNLDRLGELARRLIETTSTDAALRVEDAEPLSAEELTELREALASATDALLDQDMTDDVLAHLDTVRQALAATVGEETARAEDAANREAQREALAAEINSLLGNGSDDGGDGDEGDGDGDGDGAGEGGEGEGAEGAAAPAPVPAGVAAGAPAGAEPIAAAAGQAPAPARISNVRARRPAGATPRIPSGEARIAPFTASGNLGGYGAGTQLGTSQLGEVMEQAARLARQSSLQKFEMPLFRVELGAQSFDQERFLGRDPVLNTQRVEAVTGRRAIAAAGGICAPINVDFSMPTVGSTATPIQSEAMAQFGAEARGTIATLPPPILGDAASAITLWTEANDALAAPGGGSPSPATKACMRITCPEEETSKVDAINGCLELGNFELRYFRENVDAWQRILLVEVARFSENYLLDIVDDGSTDVAVGPLLGTVRNVFAGLDRATAKYRWLHRDPALRFRWIAPMNLFYNMRADLVRQMPVGTMDETMALAEATIDRWLAVRGINVTWHLDGLSGQTWAAQGDGVLEGWQDTASTYLYPEGEWLFLNGGRLDFGMVRDSTLNSVNDVQIQFENFGTAHHHGRDSWNITFDIVPNGQYSCCDDLDIETTGS